MTNFDFLNTESQMQEIAAAAIAAERTIHIDAAMCVMACRRAMELAVKWMYAADEELELPPYRATLQQLMDAEEFRAIVGKELGLRMKLIRQKGNKAAHGGKEITRAAAELCLENLFYFLDFVACCYGQNYEEPKFCREYLTEMREAVIVDRRQLEAEWGKERQDVDLTMHFMTGVPEQLTMRRRTRQQAYVPKPVDLSEHETRRIYIDSMLADAGWTEGVDWRGEVPLQGMPDQSGTGYADYVLYDDSHRPLAVVEAKRTCENVSKGRQQAKLYADLLEKQYNRRPVIFLTNGFETYIIDNQYPERKTAAIYSKRDLEKWFNLLAMRTRLDRAVVDREIVDRYYQEEAVKAVCDSFGNKNRRKALLVMATGSGKTRTVIALCKTLLEAGWIKNILFLADRNALITQAKRSFVNLLPDLSVTNLVEERNNYNAHCVFSTYQTMMHVIDDARDEGGRIFSCGHFDLVICDEAHRSIYNKYKDIFNYFDALLVGLTATPKEEIDKNTYSIFELASGLPTYGYELGQAVKDGYLVDYLSVETKLKFIEQGIVYDELSEEDKRAYEDTFGEEEGKMPESISASALNTWIFNEDTIRQALHILMTDGLKVNYGEKLGKTIIFAKNHDHAEKILQVFHKEYPHLPDYAMVIDNHMTYAQSAIDEFSDGTKMPQIAISVDMLDTGIDVPEILNLVFFKKVMSKAKFWQMIGRGTRLYPGLLDGEDKQKFYIFDFCGNFDFFRMEKAKPTANMMALQEAIFNMEFQIAYKLQALEHQIDRLIAYRNKLVSEMSGKVGRLNRDSFAVRQHLRYVDKYANADSYCVLTYEDTLIVREEVAPLILPDGDEVNAVRFDALMYGIELACLAGKKYNKARGDLMKRVNAIAGVANIPEIQVKSDLIRRLLQTDYVERAGIDELEYIREELRALMKYISHSTVHYDTDFADDILAREWHEAELENDYLADYRARAEYYVRKNQDNIVIAKLKMNKPLTEFDISALEKMLWGEVGSREDYERENGKKPLGEFVREIVGLDMNAAKEAFAEYLDGAGMDSRQIYFVNQIVEYIVRNGIMKDLSVLQEPPFTDRGSVAEVFSDLDVWAGIRGAIEKVNTNATA